MVIALLAPMVGGGSGAFIEKILKKKKSSKIVQFGVKIKLFNKLNLT